MVENTIYCIGGIGGKGGTYEKRLDSVESLELTEDGAKRWRQLSPMSTPRSSHTCEVMDGLIYVVGGGDGTLALYNAELNAVAGKRAQLMGPVTSIAAPAKDARNFTAATATAMRCASPAHPGLTRRRAPGHGCRRARSRVRGGGRA